MRSSASALGVPHHFVSEFVLRFREAKQSDVMVRRRGWENLHRSVRKNTSASSRAPKFADDKHDQSELRKIRRR